MTKYVNSAWSTQYLTLTFWNTVWNIKSVIQLNLGIRNFLVTLNLFLNTKCSLSFWSKLTIGHGKWYLNTNLFFIKTFLITKFDCTTMSAFVGAKYLGFPPLGLHLIWSRTHSVPGHLVPHNWSPWANSPGSFGPHGKWSPRQFVHKNKQYRLIWSPWTNGPQDNWSRWTIGPKNLLVFFFPILWHLVVNFWQNRWF